MLSNHRTVTLPILLTAFCSLLLGCSQSAGTWEYREVNRIRSPDKQAEAVVIEGDAGATTSMATLVLLTPPGKIVAKNPPDFAVVFWGEHLKNFNIAWRKPGLLEIAYEEATIYRFKNLWETSEGRDYSYSVEVRLAPSQSEFSVSRQDRLPRPTIPPERHP
jgi:hypothetical protein